MLWTPQNESEEIVLGLKRNLWNMMENGNNNYEETSSPEKCEATTSRNINTIFNNTLDEVMEEFRMNGRDSEYCPDFEVAPAISPYLSFAGPYDPPPSLFDGTWLYAHPPPTVRSRVFKQGRPRIDKRMKQPLPKECVFCKNNGEPESRYASHCVKDNLGRVLCPVLRSFTCPKCEASGDYAHTMKYCPLKDIVHMDMTEPRPRANYRDVKRTRNNLLVDLNNNLAPPAPPYDIGDLVAMNNYLF